jgi:glutamate--cysteine ligase
MSTPLLTKIRRKYKEYGINEKPFVVIKADNSSTGAGGLDRARRQGPGAPARPRPGRARRLPLEVIVQEGVLTNERMNDAVAEPVVYMMDRYVVGGFYRVHAGRGSDENLNAPGSQLHSAGVCREYALTSARSRGRAPVRRTASTCTV